MSGDSMVLRIDEIDPTKRVDTTLFAFYDHITEQYMIRGSRRGEFTPYSFTCGSQRDTSLFVEMVVGKDSTVSYTLINYSNLPLLSEEIDYDYLCDNFSPKYNELVGYDKCKLKFHDSDLNRYLRLLRVVFNDYCDEV
jgi:hypothetical protein